MYQELKHDFSLHKKDKHGISDLMNNVSELRQCETKYWPMFTEQPTSIAPDNLKAYKYFKSANHALLLTAIQISSLKLMRFQQNKHELDTARIYPVIKTIPSFGNTTTFLTLRL